LKPLDIIVAISLFTVNMDPTVTGVAPDPVFAIYIGVEIRFMIYLFTIATVLSTLKSKLEKYA